MYLLQEVPLVFLSPLLCLLRDASSADGDARLQDLQVSWGWSALHRLALITVLVLRAVFLGLLRFLGGGRASRWRYCPLPPPFSCPSAGWDYEFVRLWGETEALLRWAASLGFRLLPWVVPGLTCALTVCLSIQGLLVPSVWPLHWSVCTAPRRLWGPHMWSFYQCLQPYLLCQPLSGRAMGSDVGSLFTLEVSSVFPLEEWLRVSPVAWPYLYGLCASVVLLLRPISVSLDWMLGLRRLPEVPSLLCHCSAAEGSCFVCGLSRPCHCLPY